MLQNALLIQTIIAIITLGLLVLSCYFFSRWDEDKKFQIISVLFIIATVIGACYFLYHIFAYTDWCFSNGIIAIIKVLIPFIIGTEIIVYCIDSLDDFDVQMGSLLSVTLAVVVVILVGGLITNSVQEDKYDENVIQIEEQRYSEERHELLDKFSKSNSTSSYFNKTIEQGVCNCHQKTDCENAPKPIIKYQFYYVSDNEKKEVVYREIEAIMEYIPLEEGEKPYLLIRKYTSYAIDNNQDPPVECNIQDTYRYELHISEADIKASKKAE